MVAVSRSAETGAVLADVLVTAPRVYPARVARLAAVARGCTGAGWHLRCCAVLVLEHLFWTCETPAEEAVILAHLAPGGDGVDACELRRRISRNARLHAWLRGLAPADLLPLAARESRLVLMRWFFTPDEVAARITGGLRSSRAVIQAMPQRPEVASEAALALAGLPEWERRIVQALASAPRAFWVPVASQSGDPAGDMIESPPGTVVHVVKLPGSGLEVEIKRTGRPAPRPLSVVREQDGQTLPLSHRLDGGSSWYMLRWEAVSAARLSAVWRALHGEEAPVSRTIAVKAVYALPDGERELRVLDFFAQETEGVPRAVAVFDAEWGLETPDLEGEIAMAARFLLHASPAQSVLLGTSAHRLDRLAAALGCGGTHPDRPTLEELLDEVLGGFEAPGIAGADIGDPAGWLDAVFALPANRRRADACHRAAAGRLGELWGTFLALGACSSGESLVGRNVGLKAVFREGDWRVELISMDHDNLHVSGARERELDPAALLAANVKDELALFGGPYKGAQVRGSLDLLADLYRADEERREAARVRFFAAAREAFRRSVAALEPGGAAAGLFAPAYLADLSRWRRVAAGLEENPGWSAAVERHAGFLRRQAAIYGGEE